MVALEQISTASKIFVHLDGNAAVSHIRTITDTRIGGMVVLVACHASVRSLCNNRWQHNAVVVVASESILC